MLEEAKKLNIKSKIQIRRLSLTRQKNYRILVLKKISQMNSNVVIIDTDLFINRTQKEGYYQGSPVNCETSTN